MSSRSIHWGFCSPPLSADLHHNLCLRMSGFLTSLDPRRVQWGAAWYAMHSRILRTKPVESMLEGTGATTAHGTKLAQVLTTVDLISLGVGSCVGTGMYVVSGLVAKEMAGPGVIVSFIIAAVASILSGKHLRDGRAHRPVTVPPTLLQYSVVRGVKWETFLPWLIGSSALGSAHWSSFLFLWFLHPNNYSGA